MVHSVAVNQERNTNPISTSGLFFEGGVCFLIRKTVHSVMEQVTHRPVSQGRMHKQLLHRLSSRPLPLSKTEKTEHKTANTKIAPVVSHLDRFHSATVISPGGEHFLPCRFWKPWGTPRPGIKCGQTRQQ